MYPIRADLIALNSFLQEFDVSRNNGLIVTVNGEPFGGQLRIVHFLDLEKNVSNEIHIPFHTSPFP